MNASFNTIGVIGKFGNPAVNDTVRALARHLREGDRHVILDAATAETLGSEEFETGDRQRLGAECDLAIVVGGDGTLLNAARGLVLHDVPLLGINLGRLGFLVDISPDGMLETLDEILAGHYREEHRLLLHAEVFHEGDKVSESDAFNDVVVHKWEVARMIETETYIDGQLLSVMRSDGLIVSTPTGSTAYALSGGGPILHPTLDAMVMVPICPHAMSFRPYVTDGSSHIEIVVTETAHSHAQVTCDGQINLGIVTGDRVRISRHDKAVRLIHPMQYNFYDILRAKLNWGG